MAVRGGGRSIVPVVPRRVVPRSNGGGDGGGSSWTWSSSSSSSWPWSSSSSSSLLTFVVAVGSSCAAFATTVAPACDPRGGGGRNAFVDSSRPPPPPHLFPGSPSGRRRRAPHARGRPIPATTGGRWWHETFAPSASTQCQAETSEAMNGDRGKEPDVVVPATTTFPYDLKPLLEDRSDAKGKSVEGNDGDAAAPWLHFYSRFCKFFNTASSSSLAAYELITPDTDGHVIFGPLWGRGKIESYGVYVNRGAIADANRRHQAHQQQLLETHERQQQQQQQTGMDTTTTTTTTKTTTRKVEDANLDDPGVLFSGDPIVLTVSRLGTQLNGHRGIVHGGISALLLDDAMGIGFLSLGVPFAVTANLTVDYRAPVPEGTTVVVRVRLERRQRRKMWFRAEIVSTDGKVIYSQATTLYIIPKKVHERMMRQQNV